MTELSYHWSLWLSRPFWLRTLGLALWGTGLTLLLAGWLLWPQWRLLLQVQEELAQRRQVFSQLQEKNASLPPLAEVNQEIAALREDMTLSAFGRTPLAERLVEPLQNTSSRMVLWQKQSIETDDDLKNLRWRIAVVGDYAALTAFLQRLQAAGTVGMGQMSLATDDAALRMELMLTEVVFD